MRLRRRTGFGWVQLIAAVAVLLPLLSIACRDRAQPADGDSNIPTAGEPDQYSATVVRTVENGTARETSTSREARLGEKRREEWTEGDQNRALIWRPDLGKIFLLDLSERVYVEFELAGGSPSEPQAGAGDSNAVSRPRPSDTGDGTIQAIDHYFVERQPPTRVETRVLPSASIDGHTCAVYEQREFFSDAHSETTRRFYARDLSGLLLRVESQDEQGSASLITERRDIRTDVAPDTFAVPVDFKKVEKLRR